MKDEGHTLGFIDIKRAYFHAPCKRKVYIELPAEDQEEGMVAGFSLRAILGYLNTDDQNGLQGKIEKVQ